MTEFRLEWGAAEGTMQVCYSGSALSHEMRGLLPATNYFCRVQVRRHSMSQNKMSDWNKAFVNIESGFIKNVRLTDEQLNAHCKTYIYIYLSYSEVQIIGILSTETNQSVPLALKTLKVKCDSAYHNKEIIHTDYKTASGRTLLTL